MTWPLDMQSFAEWAEGLDCIVVVEEKRKLIEGQIKEALFNQKGTAGCLGRKMRKAQCSLPIATRSIRW